MRFWIAGLILAILVVPVIAQEHAREKKASGELAITAAVRIADQDLTPGTYRISCDRKEITFTRLESDRKVKLPCRGHELDRPARETEMYTDEQGGTRVVQKLLIRGSNVEHVF